MEIGIGNNDLTDDTLTAWIQEFLAFSSKDRGWKLKKGLEYILEDPKQ
jgi:hypothetical protein